jgi:hypothetical protein
MTWLSTLRLARKVMPELDAKQILESQMSAPSRSAPVAQAAPAPAASPVLDAPPVLDAEEPESHGDLDNQLLLLLR